MNLKVIATRMSAGVIELMPDYVIHFSFGGIFVEGDDIHDGLRILFLFRLGDATLLQHPLPFFGQALSHPSDQRNRDGA